MCKNIVESDRPQMTIMRMSFALWIPKATNTLSEYVVLIAFPLQKWLYVQLGLGRSQFQVFPASKQQPAQVHSSCPRWWLQTEKSEHDSKHKQHIFCSK
jgi:hypothetical protein